MLLVREKLMSWMLVMMGRKSERKGSRKHRWRQLALSAPHEGFKLNYIHKKPLFIKNTLI